MKDYLLFQLYGPMAAWGDTAVGEFLPSHGHPICSAILGLTAAALGIRRHEEERPGFENSAALPFGSTRREVMRDYHTTQVPPELRRKGASLHPPRRTECG